ncbi:hypothetical protein Syun_025414 [Stephania yunnanensis]|uniref:Mitochondrial glycoprotein n=1 Tax=Stephania yunnanensis TaxID=152371 RepID=A0AAP0HUY9_9MAGN
MARVLRASRRLILSNSRPISPSLQSLKPLFASRFQSRDYITEMRKSTIESNLLRTLRSEIQYELEYSPPQQFEKEFELFSIEDRKGEQWIRLRGKHGEEEDIKIEVTMFDGAVPVKKSGGGGGGGGGGEDVKLHMSLIVDISKGENCDVLEFICSAWPDALEIQKVFMLGRDGTPGAPYVGPEFKELDDELQKELQEYLEARGVNDELAEFLHAYMMNKDKTELINWMENVKCFVDK